MPRCRETLIECLPHKRYRRGKRDIANKMNDVSKGCACIRERAYRPPQVRLPPTASDPPPKVRGCRPRRTRWVIGPTHGDPVDWITRESHQPFSVARQTIRWLCSPLRWSAASGTAPVLTPFGFRLLEMNASKQEAGGLEGFALRRNQYIFYVSLKCDVGLSGPSTCPISCRLSGFGGAARSAAAR